MKNLRKLARGRPCLIRLPGCSGGGEDTVLAHYRSVSLGAGIGIKPVDWLGAHSCFSCHNQVDGRAKSLDREAVRLAHLEGVMRTIEWLIKQGHVKL
jgi:hypothetical protein